MSPWQICLHPLHFLIIPLLAIMQALDEIQANLNGLSSSCSSITNVLDRTKSCTSQLLLETERLQKEQETVERKSQLVNDFLEQYQLSTDEVCSVFLAGFAFATRRVVSVFTMGTAVFRSQRCRVRRWGRSSSAH